MMKWWPFSLRYWVIWSNTKSQMIVAKSRLSPGNDGLHYSTLGVITLDGPFDSQEDAVRALHFWHMQYEKTKRKSNA